MTITTDVRRVRSQGVQVARKGSWTLLFNLGTKMQMAALIASAVAVDGTRALGHVTTVYGAATLAASLADFGYASESTRFIASDVSRSKIITVARGVRKRAPAAALFSAGLIVIQGRFAGVTASPSLVVSVCLLGMATYLQLASSAILFGMASFREASLCNGGVRCALVPGFVIVAANSHSTQALVNWLTVVEVVVAVATAAPIWVKASQALIANQTSPMRAPHGSFLWLGLASITNTLINKSDAFLISLVATQGVVGIYAVASQLENAVTTIALTLAAALPTHVASARAKQGNYVGVVWRVTGATCAIAALGATAVLVLTSLLGARATAIPGLTSISHESLTTVALCMVAAPVSAAAGALLSAYTGVGKHHWITVTWVSAGLVTVPAMLMLPSIYGAPGAGIGALMRDTILLVAATALWSAHSGASRPVRGRHARRLDQMGRTTWW